MFAVRANNAQRVSASVEPGQASRPKAGARVGELPRARRGKGPVSPAVATDVRRNGNRLANKFTTIVVKRLTQQRVSIQKQDVARGRILGIPVGANQEAPGLSVKIADVHSTLVGQSTSHGEEEVPSIRQELRPAVQSLLRGRVESVTAWGVPPAAATRYTPPDPVPNRIVSSMPQEAPRGSGVLPDDCLNVSPRCGDLF